MRLDRGKPGLAIHGPWLKFSGPMSRDVPSKPPKILLDARGNRTEAKADEVYGLGFRCHLRAPMMYAGTRRERPSLASGEASGN